MVSEIQRILGLEIENQPLEPIRIFFLLSFCKIKNKFFLMFIFESDRARAGEGPREREMQNLKQAPDSELSAQSLTRGLNP